MRILIADDHTLFRESLRGLIESHGHEVVGEAGTGDEAVVLTRELKPDLVLMDLLMPGLGGLEATRLLSTELPELIVVVLTVVEDDERLFEAVKAGAKGYLLKSVGSEEFFRLLDNAVRGELALTPVLARRLLDEFMQPSSHAEEELDELTEAEVRVLRLLVDGVTSNRDLAKALGISENTVKFHVRNILGKLQLHNRAQAVGYALRHGLVDRSPDDLDGSDRD